MKCYSNNDVKYPYAEINWAPSQQYILEQGLVQMYQKEEINFCHKM